MARCSLIVDGNYLLYKDVFILKQSRSIYLDLPTLLKKDLDRLMKSFTFEKVYFVTDSPKSWRKIFFKEYKGNRKRDEKMDWDFIFKTFNEFKVELSKRRNVNYLSFDGAEGDDIIAYLVNENNKKGISNVIIGSDGDLHQLIKFDINAEYINIMYNYKHSDERTYLPKNHNIFINWLENQKNDIFDMSNDEEFLGYLDGLISRTKTKEVEPEKSLFIKIVAGDKKDNVQSCYKNNSRGIGEEGANTIYDIFKKLHVNDIDFDSIEFPKQLTEVIAYQKNIKDDETLNKTQENITFNIKLLRLTPGYLPKPLFEKMESVIDIDKFYHYEIEKDIELTEEELIVDKIPIEKMSVQKLEIQRKPSVTKIIEKDEEISNDIIDDFFEL